MDNNLKVEVRTEMGKGFARRTRMAGKIPGVFYYQGKENYPFAADKKEFLGLLKRRTRMIMLQIEGMEERECIIRDIQKDPVTEEIMHIDLLGIKRGQKLRVTIKTKLKGTPIGVKVGGGILQQALSSIEVECLPKDIPDDIVIDVSELEVGDSIHVGDLEMEGIKFLASEGVVVAQVVAPALAEEEETEEEEGEEGEESEEESKE